MDVYYFSKLKVNVNFKNELILDARLTFRYEYRYEKVSSYPAYVFHIHTLAFSLGQTRHVPLLRCLGGVRRILLRGGFQLNLSDIRDQFRIVHRDAVQHVISGHIGVERLPPAMKRSILRAHTNGPILH